jgi:hypothetical protein
LTIRKNARFVGRIFVSFIFLTFFGFGFACFLGSCRRQQAGDALVQLEQKGHSFGVAGVGLLATARFMGLVHSPVFKFVPIKTHLVLTK